MLLCAYHVDRAWQAALNEYVLKKPSSWQAETQFMYSSVVFFEANCTARYSSDFSCSKLYLHLIVQRGACLNISRGRITVIEWSSGSCFRVYLPSLSSGPMENLQVIPNIFRLKLTRIRSSKLSNRSILEQLNF